MTPTIINIAPVRIAYFRQIGPYGPDLARVWGQMREWAKSRGLFTESAIFYGISRDNPMTTAPEACRYDAAIVIAEDFDPWQPPAANLQAATLPGGKYLSSAFVGTAPQVGEAFRRLFMEELPQSGCAIDERRPPLERYLGNQEGGDRPGGVFHCDLCVPVR